MSRNDSLFSLAVVCCVSSLVGFAPSCESQQFTRSDTIFCITRLPCGRMDGWVCDGILACAVHEFYMRCRVPKRGSASANVSSQEAELFVTDARPLLRHHQRRAVDWTCQSHWREPLLPQRADPGSFHLPPPCSLPLDPFLKCKKDSQPAVGQVPKSLLFYLR